jgi:hypothetical protein
MGGGVPGGPPQISPGWQLGGGGVGAKAATTTIATSTMTVNRPPTMASDLAPDMAEPALPRGGGDQ